MDYIKFGTRYYKLENNNVLKSVLDDNSNYLVIEYWDSVVFSNHSKTFDENTELNYSDIKSSLGL